MKRGTGQHHRLRELHDACKRIGVLDDERVIGEATLDAAQRAFESDALLLLRPAGGGCMQPCGAPKELPELDASSVHAHCIVKLGRALSIDDVAPEQRSAYQGYAFAPLEVRNDVIGLLGVRREVGDLAAIEIELLCGLASVAAVTIAQCRAHEEALEQSRRRARLSRYFSPSVTAYLADNPEIAGGTELEATVLMCDMRGFTSFSDGRAPNEIFALLNRYLTAMVDAVLTSGGMVDKLLGDGVLAVFGAPLRSDEHALEAARCALTMLERAATLTLPPRRSGDEAQPLRIGVGMASGPLILGDVGGGGVLDFTVLGTTVNLASRIEAATKTLGEPILLTETTRTLLGERAQCVDLGLHALRGLADERRLFALKRLS